jgi:hypothetical protein
MGMFVDCAPHLSTLKSLDDASIANPIAQKTRSGSLLCGRTDLSRS